MKHIHAKEYVGYLILIIAFGMCFYSFILSEYMEIKSVLNADRLAMAVGGKGDLTLYDVIHKRMKSYAHPAMWVYTLFPLGIYLAPAIGVLILNRWVYLQLIILLPIYYLLQYDMDAIHGGYAALANGCDKCENHGFNHFLGSGAIVSISIVLLLFASGVEKYVKKKPA